MLLNSSEIEKILADNYIGRLACSKDNLPYIVPVTYCYDHNDNSLIGYTGTGKKLYMLRKNPEVCFEVDVIESLSKWKSVVLRGKFTEVQGVDVRNTMHFFVENVRRLARLREDEKVFLSDLSHAEVHTSPSVLYRIKITEKSGRYENR